MKTVIVSFVFVLGLCHGVKSLTCGLDPLAKLTCSCTNKSVKCTGEQDGSFNITSVIANISLSYGVSSVVDYVTIDVENLYLEPDSTVEGIGIKNLKLSSGLRNLPNDFFSHLNETVVQLNLKNNLFPNVPSNSLHILGKLEYLDLSYNRIVSLTQNDFIGLEKLQILNLQHNSITLMLKEPFLYLRNLESLFLDFNSLKTLHASLFQSLGELQTLSLSSNLLQDLPDDVIAELISLHRFVVDNNPISQIEDLNVLSSSVEELSAVNCSLEGALQAKSFDNLPSLKFLDLSRNVLKDIQSHALSGLQMLKELNLSNNIIETINSHAFSALHSLESLNLENNSIVIMSTSAFYNLTQLKYLNMNSNKLSGFICEYTSDLIALEVAELRNNQLKVVRAGTFAYSHMLKVLKMDGNTMECSCLASYFAGYLQNNTLLNSSDVDVILCHSPPHHQGKRLVDIDFSTMKCSAGITCVSSFISSAEDYDYDNFTDVPESTMYFSSTLMMTSTQLSTETASTDKGPSSTETVSTTKEPSSTETVSTTKEPSSTETVSTTKEPSSTETASTTKEPSSTETASTTKELTSTLLTTEMFTHATKAEYNTTVKPEIKVYNHSHDGVNYCIYWSIGTGISVPVTCSISDRVKKMTRKVTCPKSSSDFQKYCVANMGSHSRVCIKVHVTATNRLVSISCFGTSDFDVPVNTTSGPSTTEVTSQSEETKFTGYTVSLTESTKFQPFNFTYINIVPLNSTASSIEWRVNRQQSRRICHINLSISSKGMPSENVQFPCKDSSFHTVFELDVSYEICLSAYHTSQGETTFCHHVRYPAHEISAAQTADDSSSMFPIAVLIGLLLLAICIIVILVVRAMFRRKVGSDSYHVAREEQKVKRRERRQRSSEQVRYSYTVKENTDGI